MANTSKGEWFALKDCALAAIATGRRAQNLRELRDHLLVVHPGSIYYHFWGSLLKPGFDDPEYNNDFAAWAAHALHDIWLAERLGIIDPAQYHDTEALRQELIDQIEERLDHTEFLTWAPRDRQFQFIRSQIVVFDTAKRIKRPHELAAIVPTLSVGSIFYHFIDARRRTPNGMDDFRAWLQTIDKGRYEEVCERLAGLDPYFVTLTELRDQLATILRHHLAREAA
jgi:hypothetical protein